MGAKSAVYVLMGGYLAISVPASPSVAQSGDSASKPLVVDTLLNEKTQQVYCRRDGERFHVSRNKLASKIIDELGISFDLVNSTRGLPDGEFNPADSANLLSRSKPLELEIQGLSAEEQSRRKQELREVDDKIANAQATLSAWLASVNLGFSNFSIEPKPSGPFNAAEYFRPHSAFQIRCIGLEEKLAKATPGGKPGSKPRGGDSPAPAGEDKVAASADQITDRFMIRADTKDLSLARKDIKKAKFAQLTYDRDDVKKSDSTSLDGAVGFVLFDWAKDSCKTLSPSPRCFDVAGTIVPYVQFKVADRDGRKSSDYTQYGVQANFVYDSDAQIISILGIRARGADTVDDVLESERYMASLEFDPIIKINDTYLTGAPFPLFGLVDVRPDLTLVVRADMIADPGQDKLLANKDWYSSVGFDAELTIWSPAISFLSTTKLSLEYQARATSNGQPDIERFLATLSYSPAGSDYVSLTLNYTDGRDLETLVDERRLKAGIGIRY